MKNNRIVKSSYKLIIRLVVGVLSLLFLYLLTSLVLSLIPVNTQCCNDKDLVIYLKSNGVHLDIVVPIRTDIKDWGNELWIDPRIEHVAKYVSFGWGDRGFYLNTPEWSDLTLKTAINATFLNSSSAIHIDYYRKVTEDDLCKKVYISKQQYISLTKHIEDSFKLVDGEIAIIEGYQYSRYDCFYEGIGSYNLFNTCNTWTNRCLKKAGLKACLWTPFDRAILFHYE